MREIKEGLRNILAVIKLGVVAVLLIPVALFFLTLTLLEPVICGISEGVEKIRRRRKRRK